ncbi:hypothetical protein LWI28_026470 [Acer negundo]|uniref:Retrovirus-related Pol polyprotein from transposon TNT 1-94 n=1 Tax=Acer negundo TaxID=4023 RepID=A0AAD5J1S7_ACENE|nr:hypothetical protein LWI28_026470 [Acer negundo]
MTRSAVWENGLTLKSVQKRTLDFPCRWRKGKTHKTQYTSKEATIQSSKHSFHSLETKVRNQRTVSSRSSSVAMDSERCQGTFERVNLEGSNTGAAMFIRGVTSGESRDGYCINIYVNNNIQGVNNSILVGSEVKMRDPGIRLYFGDIKFPESNKSSNLGGEEASGTIDAHWKRMDVKVKSSIELHLANNVMLNVDKDMEVKQTWDKLEKVYKGDLDKRRSTTGYNFTSGGGPISWRAILQSITRLSTAEAKYIALAEARKEAVWLNGLAKEFEITQGSMVIRCDSQSTIYLVKNQVFHRRSKHIEARYHRIRDWLESKEVTLERFIQRRTHQIT